MDISKSCHHNRGFPRKHSCQALRGRKPNNSRVFTVIIIVIISLYEREHLFSATMAAFDDKMDGTRRRLFPEMGFEPMSGDHDTDEITSLDDGAEYNEGSPTSVHEYPSHAMSKKRRIAPKIDMSEDGAEVTIDLSSLSIAATTETFESPRSRALVEYGRGSLLDGDCTPTPPPPRDCGITDWCCTTPSCQAFQEDEYISRPGDAIERTISSFLEDPGNSNSGSDCQGWQAWSFLLGNDSNSADREEPSKEHIKSNLRNRAFNLGARKSRVQQLRNDLDPFGNSPRRSPAPDIVKSKSFSAAEKSRSFGKKSMDKIQPKKTSLANVLHLCTMPENATVDSPMIIRNGVGSFQNADICYDSDPEDFTKRGYGINSDVNKENFRKNQLYKYSYPRSISTSPTGRFEDRSRDDAFSAVVQEIFNGSSTLIYHPTSKSDNGDVHSLTPIAVHAWLERGQRLASIIQPKWMWKSKPRGKNGSGSGSHQTGIKGVELLDITRILKVYKVNRTYYPFAKPANSFIIRTIDNEEHCFEAQSPNERNRLVYSLKLVVARFGAKVVVGDPNVYYEFFASSHGVPGDAPDFMQMCEAAGTVA